MRDGPGVLSRLDKARKDFELSWMRTGSAWDDAVQRAFGREHLEPILKQVSATQAESERLLQTVAQARRNVH